MKKVVIYIGIIAATVVTFTLCAWAISALFECLIDVSDVFHDIYMNTHVIEYIVYGMPVSIALDVLVGLWTKADVDEW